MSEVSQHPTRAGRIWRTVGNLFGRITCPFVTRREFDVLKCDMDELKCDMDELKLDMVGLKSELKTDMGKLKSELKTDIDGLENRLQHLLTQQLTDCSLKYSTSSLSNSISPACSGENGNISGPTSSSEVHLNQNPDNRPGVFQHCLDTNIVAVNSEESLLGGSIPSDDECTPPHDK